MNFLGSTGVDVAIVISVLFICTLVDIWPYARKRHKAGGPLLTINDFKQRRYILIYVPIILIVAFSQNIFMGQGYQTRDDVPYFLSFFGLLTIIVIVLVWWTRNWPE